MQLNFEGIEMHQWNNPMNRAQKIDLKNMVIGLVTMFTTRVMAIRMSKMAACLHFLLMTVNNGAPERSY